MQHFTIGECGHRIGRHDRGKDVPDGWRLAPRDAGCVDAIHHEPFAGADDGGQKDRNRNRNGRGGQIQNETFAADTAKDTNVANPRHAADQRKEHQRNDQHFQGIHEHLADHGKQPANDMRVDKVRPDFVKDHTQNQTAQHGQHDLRRQGHFRRLSARGPAGVPAFCRACHFVSFLLLYDKSVTRFS